jgi:putative transposase
MRYRRDGSAGASWFFTVNLARRDSGLLVAHVGHLRNVVRRVRQRHPFVIEAIVVLPDHVHAIWTLPEGDSDYSQRWGLIKAGFSRGLPLQEVRSASRVSKGERGIWQRRFWEHRIRDDRDFENHVAYIHHNPVKHGHVRRAREWPHSSLHQYIRQGRVIPDWSLAPEHDTNTNADANAVPQGLPEVVGWGERSEPQHSRINPKLNSEKWS